MEGRQPTPRGHWAATLDESRRGRISRASACSVAIALALLACCMVVAAEQWGSGMLRKSLPLDSDPGLALSLQEIVVLSDFVDGCPYYAVSLTESECRDVPSQFAGKMNHPFVVKNADDPRGCFSFHGLFYYNEHDIGGGKRAGRKVYCRRSNVSSRFQKITHGVCTDFGYLPISAQITCEAAAKEMGLANPNIKITTLAGRPEGCYYFKNFRDGTATLWMSTNSLNQGVGVQEPDNPGEYIRQPVCMAQTTTMIAKREMAMAHAAPSTSTLTLTTTAPATTTTVGGYEYAASNDFTNACPSGSLFLNVSECRSLPSRFGGQLHIPFIIESDKDPRGCFFFFKWYYYNTHTIGKGRRGRRPYCKHPRTPTNAPGKNGIQL